MRSPTSEPSIVVLGAGGFVGRALLGLESRPAKLKAVARRLPAVKVPSPNGITWLSIDLLEPASLQQHLEPGDVVINLVYMADADEATNLRLIDGLVEACISRGCARLVHCSTAVVAGATTSSRIDEQTECVPTTPYERAKLAIERRVLSALRPGLDIGVLRPTAIVGAGGKNLHKLTTALRAGNPFVNYLRACLFGRRPMHLVPVRDVARALVHLAILPDPLCGNVYIASLDDSFDNTYERVEAILRKHLGLSPRWMPRLLLPQGLLRFLQRLVGRTASDPARYYNSNKLRATRFTPDLPLDEAIREFAESVT